MYRLIQLQHKRYKIYFGFTNDNLLSFQSSYTPVTRVSTEILKIVTRNENNCILGYVEPVEDFFGFRRFFGRFFGFVTKIERFFGFTPKFGAVLRFQEP